MDPKGSGSIVETLACVLPGSPALSPIFAVGVDEEEA